MTELSNADFPLITVGLTCYNAEATIGRAIASALAQDWPHVEVIVVDDVSSDNSVAAVERAIAKVPNATLIRHTANTGPAGARNSILQAAKGEFVAFFDDDDESLPSRLSEQVATILAYEEKTGAELVACYASGLRKYPNGYEFVLRGIGSQGAEAPNGPGVADYLLLYRKRPEWFYGSGTPTCSLMARRRCFEHIGGFDGNLRRVEDADLAIRWALAGCHFIGTEKPVFVQYATDAQDKSAEMNYKAEQKLAEKNRTYLEALGCYTYAYLWPELRYWHFKRNYGHFVLVLLRLLLRNPVAVCTHLLATGPKRLLHERRMRRKATS